jgi:hypothetical protein
MTTFDAAIRYGRFLDEIETYLDPYSFSHLFMVSKIFRDKIVDIHLYRPRPETNTRYPKRNLMEEVKVLTDAEKAGREDAIEVFCESSDNVYLLSACFRNLHDAKLLNSFTLDTVEDANLVFTALSMASFPRKVVDLVIYPQDMANREHGSLTRVPELATYTRSVEF